MSTNSDHEFASELDEEEDFENLNIEVELKEMQKEEEEMIKSLSNSAKNDLEKGTHLKNQMVILVL